MANCQAYNHGQAVEATANRSTNLGVTVPLCSEHDGYSNPIRVNTSIFPGKPQLADKIIMLHGNTLYISGESIEALLKFTRPQEKR